MWLLNIALSSSFLNSQWMNDLWFSKCWFIQLPLCMPCQHHGLCFPVNHCHPLDTSSGKPFGIHSFVWIFSFLFSCLCCPLDIAFLYFSSCSTTVYYISVFPLHMEDSCVPGIIHQGVQQMAWYMTISKCASCGWRWENSGNDDKWAWLFLVWHFKLLYRLYTISFIKVSTIPTFRLNLLLYFVCVP